MKIGLVTGHFPPKSNAGSERIRSFVESWMQKDGVEIEVFTEKQLTENRRCDNNTSFANNVSIKRACSRIADNRHSNIVRILSEIWVSFLIFFKLLRSNVDVYFVSSPPFLLATTVFIVSELKKKQYIIDVRDLYPEALFQTNILDKTSLPGRVLQKLEEKIYDNALLITTVTKGLKKYINNKTTTKVSIIRNGFDANSFYPGDDLNPNQTFKILFHGNLGTQQNIEFIINYAKYLKEEEITDVKIWVLGRGEKKKKLVEAINDFNLENILKFKGFKKISEIPNYIRQTDVCFSPRKDGILGRTAFPVKVYECLGCGNPAIVSPRGEAGKYLEENKVGFQVKNNDQGALHDKVELLKNQRMLYKNYSKRAIKLSEEFNRRKIADRLFELIKNAYLEAE